MGEEISFGSLVCGLCRVIATSAFAALGYVIGMGVLGSAVDLSSVSEPAANLTYTVGSTIGGYYLLRTMLRDAGLPVVSPGKRLGSYFWMSLLTGAGILVGFVLLIVPGVILLVRWLPVYAALLSEDATVSEALESSWRRTKPFFWPLLGAATMVILLAIVCFAIYGSSDWLPGMPIPFAIVSGNLALAGNFVIFTALGVTAHCQLPRDAVAVSEIP